MGKSLNNVVTPDDMCERYGADTFRMYEMGMGPMDMSRPWQTRDVVGSQRYLQRLWRLVVSENHRRDDRCRRRAGRGDPEAVAPHHRRGVAPTTRRWRYNTAIAKLIVLTNHLTKSARAGAAVGGRGAGADDGAAGPAHREELWQRLGHAESLAHGPFPVADPALLVAEQVEYPIQVKGKVRARITVAADAAGRRVEAAALAEPRIVELLAGAAPRKVVVVPGQMVSIVP